MGLGELRITDTAWAHCSRVLRPVLALAPVTFIDDVAARLAEHGIQAAVAARDSAVLFDWIVALLARQGISNHAAITYAERNGSPTFAAIATRMAEARCPRLRSHWHYVDCGYRRSTGTCSTPHHRLLCPVTTIPARKGTLAEAAIAFWLFVRDVAGGDLVGWIAARPPAADPGAAHPHRATVMRSVLIDPLVHLPGIGPKVSSMILAELLLAGDPQRERWVTTGASFIAIDSLVHGFLHRTGILRRLEVDHAYGPACHAPGGCADVVAALAERIDAQALDPAHTQTFPRRLQHAIWQFCAEGGHHICNGTRINDTAPCAQGFCPAFQDCDRVALHPATDTDAR